MTTPLKETEAIQSEVELCVGEGWGVKNGRGES